MRFFRELILWAGAALGLLAVAAGIAVAFGGYGFLIFRSGSMSPEIPTGGIALSRTVQAADIRPGDVVSVTAANGERITHRVVSTTLRGDETTLVLKGDANRTQDSELYVVTDAERVVASLPYGGYVVVHALTPPGLLALACFSMMLVLISGSRDEDGPDADDDHDDDETDEPRAPGGRHLDESRRRSVAARSAGVLASVALGFLVVTGSNGTWATFTDKPTANTATLTAATVNPPASITCDTATTSIRWTAPTSGTPTGYRMNWSYNAGSGTIDFASNVFSGRPPSPGFFGNRQYTVTISAVYGSWSAATASDTIRGQNYALGTTWTC